MIRLGDVNFALGADTRGLQDSVNKLHQFGRAVDAAAAASGKGAAKIAADYQRQERAATEALNKTLELNRQLRRHVGADRFVQGTTSAFQQLNNTLTSGRLNSLQYQRALEQFRASTNNTTRDFKAWTQEAGKAGGANKGLVSGLQNLSSGMVFIQGPLGGFATRLSSIVALLRRGGLEVAAFIGGMSAAGIAIFKLGQAIHTAGRQANAFMSQFTAVTGSQELAEQQMRKVILIARESGQRIEDLGLAYAKFMAAAKGTGLSLAEVDSIFMNVAKAATTMNMSAEQSQGIFKALEQILSKGTVQAEELRGQLGDRLAGAVQMAARAMGVTTVKLQEMMKKGELVSRDFLPKFSRELAKSLNLMEGKAIDNYTSSLNNMSNAWFQLRLELDKQYKVTQLVMQGYQLVTKALDFVRTNLREVQIYAVAATGALAGFVAPSIIGGIIAVTRALNGLTMGFKLFGVAVLAILRIPLMIAAAVAAVTKFRYEIKLLQSDVATLGDYMDVIWSDIANSDIGTRLTQMWRQAVAEWKKLLKDFGSDWDISWSGLFQFVVGEMQKFAADMRSLAFEIGVYFKGIFGNIMADVQMLAGVLNSGRKWLSPWLDEPTNGQQPNQGFSWYEENFAGKNYERTSWNSMQMQIEAYRKNMMSANDDIVTKYLDALNGRANRSAMARIYNDPSRKLDIPGAAVNTTVPGFDGKIPPAEMTDKQIKAAQKRTDAINAMNEAIARTREEVEVLMVSETAHEQLMERFKREKEVKKYADAMKKAGVETQITTQKSAELLALLERRDALEKAAEAMNEFQQSLVNGFSTAWSAVVDGLFEGQNALESLKGVAKQVVSEIIQTFFRLSILNPLLNGLFGQNNPTLSGGLLGNIGNAFGGLGGGANFVPNTSYAGFLGVSGFASGGAFGSGGLITTPTMFNYGGGNIGEMGEAGTEAIMPLERNSRGQLGVVASVPRGGGGNVIVNVYGGEGRAEVNQSTDGQGNNIIDVFINAAAAKVAGDVAKGGTAINKAMEGRYGLQGARGLK